MALASQHTVRVFAPGSLSNLGPGYDTAGLALRGLGDVVEARLTKTGRITVQTEAPLPLDVENNTAARAARVVLDQAGSKAGLELTINKGIPLGSGIGGSAASAAGGAWAANLLLGAPFGKGELVDAVLEGESAASGGVRHGDNALPALFGGLIITSPANPSDFRRIEIPRQLHLALLLPDVKILTSEARTRLPKEVAFRDSVLNASDLAFLLHALIAGDWEHLAPYMMRDRLVEPVRAERVPGYHDVREAALATGAYGVALTGSGPATFAVAPDSSRASAICDAMVKACPVPAQGVVTQLCAEGVRRCT